MAESCGSKIASFKVLITIGFCRRCFSLKQYFYGSHLEVLSENMLKNNMLLKILTKVILRNHTT